MRYNFTRLKWIIMQKNIMLFALKHSNNAIENGLKPLQWPLQAVRQGSNVIHWSGFCHAVNACTCDHSCMKKKTRHWEEERLIIFCCWLAYLNLTLLCKLEKFTTQASVTLKFTRMLLQLCVLYASFKANLSLAGGFK